MSAPYDRPTTEPGGMDCQECGVIFVGAEWHELCAVCDARARLHLAAPELLGALKELRSAWVNGLHTSEQNRALMAKVRAAIQKAEGGST